MVKGLAMISKTSEWQSSFLDASLHLYNRVCQSVGPSIGPSVGPSITLSSKTREIHISELKNAKGGISSCLDVSPLQDGLPIHRSVSQLICLSHIREYQFQQVKARD